MPQPTDGALTWIKRADESRPLLVADEGHLEVAPAETNHLRAVGAVERDRQAPFAPETVSGQACETSWRPRHASRADRSDRDCASA
jgi:hypothetical protein